MNNRRVTNSANPIPASAVHAAGTAAQSCQAVPLGALERKIDALWAHKAIFIKPFGCKVDDRSAGDQGLCKIGMRCGSGSGGGLCRWVGATMT